MSYPGHDAAILFYDSFTGCSYFDFPIDDFAFHLFEKRAVTDMFWDFHGTEQSQI